MKQLNIFGLCVLLLCALCFNAGAMTLKIATAAPEGSKWMRNMRAGAEEVSSRSDGRVRIKFFAGGIMGNDKSVMRKIRVGQLHGGAFVAGSLDAISADVDLLSLPLLFRSYAEVDYVRPRIDAALKASIEDNGFACFGFAEGGFAHLMSGNPVMTLADMRGRKVWVPEGDSTSYRGMQSLGLAPVTLPITDVMTGLQAGLINVIAASPIGALAFQWHTRVKYVTNTPLSYLYASMIISKKAFNKLSASDQAMVREVMGKIYQKIDKDNRQDNQDAIDAMAGQGIKFIDSPQSEIDIWRQVGADLAEELRSEGAFSSEIYQRILGYLKEYRDEHLAKNSSK